MVEYRLTTQARCEANVIIGDPRTRCTCPAIEGTKYCYGHQYVAKWGGKR